MRMPRVPQVVAALVASALLAGCGVPRALGIAPYKIEVQQGNFVSQDMVAQLKPGMTREQVRFILGTPLITDIFHGERWDYIYYREAPDGKRENRRIAVFFSNDKLERLEGDVVSPAAGR